MFLRTDTRNSFTLYRLDNVLFFVFTVFSFAKQQFISVEKIFFGM